MEQPINSIVDKPQIEQEELTNNIVDVPHREQPTDEPTTTIIDEQSIPIVKRPRGRSNKQAPQPETTR